MRNSLSITAKNVIECKKTVCNAEKNSAQAKCCLIYPPRTADKLYVCEFFEEKLGFGIAQGSAIPNRLTKIEKSSIFNLLL